MCAPTARQASRYLPQSGQRAAGTGTPAQRDRRYSVCDHSPATRSGRGERRLTRRCSGPACGGPLIFFVRRRKTIALLMSLRGAPAVPNDKAQESGSIRLDGDVITYASRLYGSFSLPVEDIAVIGEFTTDNGPVIDDWFLVFVCRGGDWFKSPIYSDGSEGVRKGLSMALGRTSISAWPAPRTSRVASSGPPRSPDDHSSSSRSYRAPASCDA